MHLDFFYYCFAVFNKLSCKIFYNTYFMRIKTSIIIFYKAFDNIFQKS